MTVSTSYAGTVALPRSGRVAAGVFGALVFAGLTFVGASIRIPLEPVPITLQTLFVILTGAVIGSRYGLLGQGLYVGAGVAGLPLFAGTLTGLAVIAGPTGGYLVGFLVAPIIVGTLIRRRDTIWWSLLVFYLASLTILSLGVLHLSLFYTRDLGEALRLGYLPFIPGDLLKVVAAASIYRSYNGIRRYRANR
jgi:biotin transport system substrate-specific component